MATNLQIDTLAFAKKIRAAGAEEKLAETIVEGINTADISNLATKQDVAEHRQEMKQMEYRMTLRLGTITVVALTAFTALGKLF